MFKLDGLEILKQLTEAIYNIDNALTEMVKLLSSDITKTSMWALVERMIEISQTIALLLVVAYWLIGFVNELTEIDWRHLSIWWYIKKIIQIILAKALVDLAPNICIGIYAFVGWAIKEYSPVAVNSMLYQGVDFSSLYTSINNMGIMEKLVYKMDLLIPQITISICSIVIQVIAHVRMITICLLTIISPICLSTVVNKGVSGAYGFIKEYVGTVAQSVIMIISFALYKGMIGGIIDTQITGWEGIWKLVVSTIVLVITVLSSQSIAKMLAGR
jgi:hypothetical protein